MFKYFILYCVNQNSLKVFNFDETLVLNIEAY